MRFLSCFILGVCISCASQNSLQSEDNIFSATHGFEASVQIVGRPDLQKQFGVSQDQLVQLKKLIENERIGEVYSRIMFDQDLNASLDSKRFHAREEVDKLVRDDLDRILTPDQFDMMRLSYMRNKFVFPLGVLYPSQSFGLSQDEYARIEAAIKRGREKIDDDLMKLRRDFLEGFLSELSEGSKQRFVNLFGGRVIASSTLIPDPTIEDWNAIQILPESKEPGQVMLAFSMPLPKQVALTREQLQQLNLVHIKWLKANRNRDLDAVEYFKEPCRTILRNDQRIEIVRCIQEQHLLVDLSTIARSYVLEDLKLSKSEWDLWGRAAKEKQSEINRVRILLETQVLIVGLNALPTEKQDRYAKLVKGVWPLE